MIFFTLILTYDNMILYLDDNGKICILFCKRECEG